MTVRMIIKFVFVKRWYGVIAYFEDQRKPCAGFTVMVHVVACFMCCYSVGGVIATYMKFGNINSLEIMCLYVRSNHIRHFLNNCLNLRIKH